MKRMIFGIMCLSLLSGCADYKAAGQDQSDRQMQLAAQDRELKVAVNVVVERLRQVEDAQNWQSIEPLSPQIYELATALLPGGQAKSGPKAVLAPAVSKPQSANLQQAAIKPAPKRRPTLLPPAPEIIAASNPGRTSANPPFAKPPTLENSRSLFLAAQLGSYRSSARAMSGWEELHAKAPEILTSLRSRIENIDLGQRGEFYRLKAGPLRSEAELQAVCQQLIARGVPCIRADFTGSDPG